MKLDDSKWQPPVELVEFIAAGHTPPVYIGFGSIIVDDPDHFSRIIYKGNISSHGRYQ